MHEMGGIYEKHVPGPRLSRIELRFQLVIVEYGLIGDMFS